MDRGEEKVFKTPLSDSVILGVIIAAFQIFIITGVFEGEFPETPDLLFLMIFAETILFIFLLHLLTTATGKITITHRSVVISNIFKRKTVPLYHIHRTRKLSVKGGFLLVIETPRSKIKVGANLSSSQIDEATAYIREQIRLNYPQYYSTLKDEKTHELDEFWRK